MPESYPYFLSRDWDLPNRAERITELLAATPLQSPGCERRRSRPTRCRSLARRLVPLMTRIVPAERPGMAREAIERLRDWDFRMDADKVEPLLFTAWLRDFAHDVFLRHLGEAAADYWDLKPQVIEAVLTAHPEWCGGRKRRPGAAMRCWRSALDAALAELRRAYGPEMAQWQWGRAHIARFANPVFGRIALLRDWFQRQRADRRAASIRSTAARPRSATRRIPTRSASAPDCASSPILRRPPNRG